jgi:hypothetical protein
MGDFFGVIESKALGLKNYFFVAYLKEQDFYEKGL